MTTSTNRGGRPPSGRPHMRRVHVQLEPDTLDTIDKARGREDRSAWIRRVVEQELSANNARPGRES